MIQKEKRCIRKKGHGAFLLSVFLLAALLSGCADKEAEPSRDGAGGAVGEESSLDDATGGGEGEGSLDGAAGGGGKEGSLDGAAGNGEEEGFQDGAPGIGGEEDSSAAIVFEGQDMEGNVISSDIFAQSKLTMINVWATYCDPCLREMPELAQLPDEYDAADFQLIGIISDVMEEADGKLMEEAADLIEQTGADYPHMLMNYSVYEALLTDVMAVPTTFFLDGEGNVLDTVIGAMDKEAWKEKIDGLLEEL